MKTTRSLGKTLISLGLFAGLSAAPALALAGTDNFVEIRFEARAFGDLLLRQIATSSNFCPQLTVHNDRDVYADHLEMAGPGELHRAQSSSMIAINGFTEVESTRLFYTQPIDVHLKTVECASEPGCSETVVIPAELTYVLYTTESSKVCMKVADARGLPQGVYPPEVEVCLPFNARAALKAAGLSGDTPSGSAVTLSGNGERVAVRVELGRTADDYDSQRVRDWRAFADGEIEPTGSTDDWSVFLHKSLLLGAVERRLASTLQDQAGVHLDGPIETVWNGGETGAHIEARANGSVSTDLCGNRIHVNDIVFDAKIAQNAPLDPTGLSIAGSVSYDIDNGDAAQCGLALGGPMGALVLGALADAVNIDIADLGPNCHPGDGDFAFTCDERTHPQLASIGPLQGLVSNLSSVVGSETGLAMHGLVKISGNPALTSSGVAVGFETDDSTGARVGALRMAGTARLCGATFHPSVPGGDVGLLNIEQPAYGALPGSFRVTLPHDRFDAFHSHPFRLRATVLTSAGVGTYELESPM